MNLNRSLRSFARSGIWILAIAAISCSQRQAQKNTNTTTASGKNGTEVKQDTLIASLKRTACYGQCPIYEINVYHNGYATYEGERFVEREGKFYSNIPQQTIDTIIGYARHIGYFNMKDEYMGYIEDFPTVITTISADGKNKTIKSRSDVPEKLTDFQNFFDKQFKETNWKPLR